ncbi:restriction endonuclease [Pseudomonas matsuisoli]|uniref:Restriction endonuclease type IV Mrr domain-containing protein n=1 Tax=Pseudomonas matsuisoli TaxID=1515666 RepID=A0A917Q577_9PSED|nr:restriction endonuclease [Pseudomonas matsuisoli]GGK10217.1 hypothetical protein GCM10009304_40330 [Pseudomonas matsuisoli]
MARRHKTTPLEDLMYVAAKFPWWLTLALAAFSFLWLRAYVGQPIVTVTDPKLMANALPGQSLRTLASVGQYLLPLALLCGAAASIFARDKQRKRVDGVARVFESEKTLDGVSWQVFEARVREAFVRNGFSFVDVNGEGAREESHFLLLKDSEKHVALYQHWRSSKVGIDAIHDCLGAMAAEGAVGGFIVTDGAFTRGARSFAHERGIQLLDASALKRWNAKPAGAGSSGTLQPVSKVTAGDDVSICPVCCGPKNVCEEKSGACWQRIVGM